MLELTILVLALTDIGLVVTLCLVVAWRDRSGRQTVTRSSAPPPVAGSATSLVARPTTSAATEQAAYDAIQRNQILTRLAKQFPSMGEGKREAVADEIMAKGRAVLARIR